MDPDEPSILVLELDGQGYVEKARAVGDESVDVTVPFPLRLSARELLR